MSPRPRVTPETLTSEQLGQVLLQLHGRIEFLEDMLSHTIVLLLEARGTIQRPDDQHVTASTDLLLDAVQQWRAAHKHSREIEQELRDEQN